MKPNFYVTVFLKYFLGMAVISLIYWLAMLKCYSHARESLIGKSNAQHHLTSIQRRIYREKAKIGKVTLFCNDFQIHLYSYRVRIPTQNITLDSFFREMCWDRKFCFGAKISLIYKGLLISMTIHQTEVKTEILKFSNLGPKMTCAQGFFKIRFCYLIETFSVLK